MEPETKTQTSTREKGRGRSRWKKKQVMPDSGTKMKKSVTSNDESSIVPEIVTLDLDADITQLEAPTFSTINKGPPEPMLRLNWNHKTHLIGEKVINPMIHCCDKCNAPILIYGRMIPCKHVFCLTCAENDNKVCPRCQEKIIRIEKTGVGTVFMCTFGGTRYGNTGCRRTYLSQRDLEAHINHRHVSGSTINKESLNSARSSSSLNPVPIAGSRMKLTVAYHMAAVNDPRVHTSSNSEYYKINQSPSSAPSSTSPPSLRHSYLQSYLPHQSEQSINNQHSMTLQSKQIQRHLPVSTAQQLLQSTNFVKQMICSYPQSTSNSVTSTTNVRSNLIAVPIQDQKGNRAKIVSTAAGFSARTTNISRNYSQQFSHIPFPVPSPGKPVINSAQTEYFSPTSLKAYLTTSPQQSVMSQFSPSTSTQPIINPSQLIPASTSTPIKTQFPSNPVIPSFPVPLPQCHGWYQPSTSQTNFY